LENLIGRQPDRVFESFGLQELVDLRVREGGIGAEVAAFELTSVAGHDRLNHLLPTVRRMNVAGTKRGAFQIAELIEHEQRMIAGASEVAVVGGAFLITVGWADTRIHVEHDCPRRLAGMNAVDPMPGEVGERDEVLTTREPLRLEAPHLAG
jgi:hypothetical protein